MIKAVIIDDIAQARATLKEDLATYCPTVEVIGEAEGVVSGAKLLRKVQPDVIFLDIQMQDGSGFDLLEVLGDIPSQIIFTTAHDTFAIKAFRFSALDYLLKPVDPDLLVAAVEKVTTNSAIPTERLQVLLDDVQEKKQLTRLALHTMEKIHIVQISDIVRCESSANYTIFYFADKRQLLVTKTLKEFDNLLSSGHRFLRVHQSHLVNTDFIKEFVKIDGGYLVMTDKAEVPVSSRKRSQVMKMINAL
ncbi:MAG: LytTR family DNA-binding domain-containing protein [Bacteroidota bacterium]